MAKKVTDCGGFKLPSVDDLKPKQAKGKAKKKSKKAK